MSDVVHMLASWLVALPLLFERIKCAKVDFNGNRKCVCVRARVCTPCLNIRNLPAANGTGAINDERGVSLFNVSIDVEFALVKNSSVPSRQRPLLTEDKANRSNSYHAPVAGLGLFFIFY